MGIFLLTFFLRLHERRQDDKITGYSSIIIPEGNEKVQKTSEKGTLLRKNLSHFNNHPEVVGSD